MRAYAKDLKTYEGTFKEIQKKLSGKNTWEFEEMMAILTEEEISIMNGNADELGYNIRQIMQLLWKDNRYSFDLEQTPKGEDIVKDFLLRQHKGYCTHFASAATLLLRMKGIPARYASGYLVLTSDFKENADGTWTAAVTDERAHAWTEVFYNNLGFCPIEATPPEYKEMLDGMDEGQTVANAVQQMDREYEQQHPEADRKDEEQIQEPQKEPDDGNTASEAGKPQPGMKNKRGNGDRTGIAEFLSQSRRILISAGLAVFAAAGLYLFLYLRRRWVLNGRKKRFEQNDRAQAVCEMGKELGRILELLGIKRMRGMDDREYLRVLEDELQEIDWEQFFLIFRKAKYSGQEIDKKEYGRAVYLYRNMEQRLVGKGKVRDWYIRYVKIYS